MKVWVLGRFEDYDQFIHALEHAIAQLEYEGWVIEDIKFSTAACCNQFYTHHFYSAMILYY